ncbi:MULTISPECIES: RNA polymerase sigma factor [unclassified Streptomyces]|uniref:RNA polymerase sigma factor n=1 Tax=unclassified Streptomyces TaxID=2593676 RepID=UPI00224E5B96|nr:MULTISPECIES: RNA polymerase sigma factor [unclassified Streptomyces]MCX4524271.1 RNA polymerase sigma factor [Streptomyces sp. NBC_01551]MCX4545209.1 RNA polymerase sigma factor [Streptomyces sp. NBC_01565]
MSAAQAVETVFRIESARIIAGVARIVRDVGIAEEIAQDALVAALEQWPESGVPDKPGAWLMATAKHRAIDLVRRKETYARKLAEVGRTLEDVPPPEEPAGPEDIDDDLLRLIFTACHPVLATEARIALTLRLMGGLTTQEIARAFLTSEPTVAQRIVRAKRALAKAGVPFEVPYGADREQRLSSVLEVIYLIFNEGYSATAGDDLVRPALCEDALRLARVLAALMPKEPEVHGLAALLEFQASRIAARTGPDGEPVLLADQNRGKWNRLLIRRGVLAMGRAGSGPYSVQAAIAGCHADAVRYEDTDWPTIAALYGRLVQLIPSPVVELNRAVAVSMADGPEAALPLVDALAEEPALRAYHLLPSVRGDLLGRLGRRAEARAEFERAASLTRNARERALLLRRAAEVSDA